MSKTVEKNGMKISRLCPNIGAEISGIDLRKPLSDEQYQTIYEAWVQYEVLVFRNQPLSVEQHMQLGQRFGELTIHPFSPNLAEHPEVIILDNHKGQPPRYTDCWHSDETFRATPPAGTMLLSTLCPELGGDTLFASMTTAYDRLNDRIKHLISGLHAVHDFIPFRSIFSDSAEDKEKLRKIEDEYPKQTHPLVRIHPVSGKKILYVNPQFTTHIVGMSAAESLALLQLLYKQTDIPEVQLRISWQKDTLVFWDNTSTQHYAVHDYWPQRRRMQRVTIEGGKVTGMNDTMAHLESIGNNTDRGLESVEGEYVTRHAMR